MGSDRLAKRGRSPSRRVILTGGLGAAVALGAAATFELIEAGALPGKYALARLDGACGSAPPSPRGTPPVRTEVTFHSVFRRRTVTMVTLTPSDAISAGLTAAIGLHGAGSDARQLASLLSPAMTAAKITNLAVTTVDGGDTYWHKRADGDDPVRMIIDEVLPRLAVAGHDISRIAITGDSMGGYGALLLAEQLAHRRPSVTAVAALSPAIFASYTDAVAASPGSFDSRADFARHDVRAGAGALRGVPTWIACGTDDPFQAETTRLRARVKAISGNEPPGGILSGCHDDAFWARNLPNALEFLAQENRRGTLTASLDIR